MVIADHVQMKMTIKELSELKDVCLWKAYTKCGRQGDVLIVRLTGPELESAKADRPTYNRKIDMCVAKGSRAAHVAKGDVTVWEPATQDPKNPVLFVEARSPWALVHTDTKKDAHHPHVIPAGWYTTSQQQEATPTGIVQD